MNSTLPLKKCPLCDAEYTDGELCPEDGATLVKVSVRLDPLQGQTLKGTYRIHEKIAQGGMGFIYRATQMPIGRTVAVKAILPHQTESAEQVQRFIREAKLLSQINHPNVVNLIDFGNTEDGIIYMVMEYLTGRTLDKVVPKGKGLPLDLAVDLMEQIAAGVGAAHRNQMIHRDLKPSNIFLANIGGESVLVKVLDFGIAKRLGNDPRDNIQLTQHGVLLGSCGYMSPEQISGNGPVDTRSDIYALGGILYYLLAGHSAYRGQNTLEILSKQMREPPPPIEANGRVRSDAQPLMPVILTAMQLDPSRRYQSVREMTRDIHAALGNERDTSMNVQRPIELGSAAAPPDEADVGQGPDPAKSASNLQTALLTPVPKTAPSSADGIREPAAPPGHPLGHQPAGTPPARYPQPPAVPAPAPLAPLMPTPIPGQSAVIVPTPGGKPAVPPVPRVPGNVAVITVPTPPQVPQPTQGRSNTLVMLLVCLAVVGSAAGGAFYYFKTYAGQGAATTKSGPSQPTLTATDRGVTAEEILLGMSAPFSGGARELGRGVKLGFEAAFEEVNAQGGVNGRKLKLVALDDGYEPSKAVKNVKTLIDERKVFALVGNVGTPTTKAALPYILDHKTLLFAPYTGASLFRNEPPDRYVFNYRASYGEETAALVEYLLEARRYQTQDIAVFAQNDEYGNAGFDGVVAALRKKNQNPGQVVRVSYERNSVDVDEAVATIRKQRTISAVVIVSTYHPAALLINKLRQAEFTGTFAALSFVDSDALADELRTLGTKNTSDIIITQVVPMPTSHSTGVSRYQEALRKSAPNEPTSFASLEGYLAACVFIEGLKKTGPNLTTERLIEHLETIRNMDLGVGPVRFGPSEHQAVHRVWATTFDPSLKTVPHKLEE